MPRQTSRIFAGLRGATSDDAKQHTHLLRALREALEQAQRVRGDHMKSFVRLDELRELGLADDNGNLLPVLTDLRRAHTVRTVTFNSVGASSTPLFFTRPATLKRAVMLADAPGDAEVDIKKVPLDGYDPAGGISIVGNDPPRLDDALVSSKSEFAGWVLDVGSDEILNVSLASMSGPTQVTLHLFFGEAPCLDGSL